jgi:hypothetical protein
MSDLVKWMAAATLSLGASIGTAAAADVPPPYAQPRYSQPQPPPEYYPPPPPRQERYSYEERYDYQEPPRAYQEPPRAYVYPPAPPPRVYGYYEEPVVLPPPVYTYPYYPYRRHYAYRDYGPRIVRGPYGHPRHFRNW